LTSLTSRPRSTTGVGVSARWRAITFEEHGKKVSAYGVAVATDAGTLVFTETAQGWCGWGNAKGLGFLVGYSGSVSVSRGTLVAVATGILETLTQAVAQTP
jgi:hypothetical protein